VWAIALTAAATTTPSLWQGVASGTALLHGMQTLIAGLGMLGFLHILRLNLQLVAAREELARMAVAQERLRFARDLHDLLGHSLSVTALKSELAGGLLAADPTRAAGELRDIEQVARRAPAEVREATTNVVRHSGATSCRIRFTEDGDRVAVEITDDGNGAALAGQGREGRGLAGLAERVAAVGGRLQAGPRPDGGFRLRVELPLKVPAA
jgi:two-component system, NarL family, sensor histidine kinase DesK